MRTKSDSESRPVPFINGTPLIDVLVLLIIFMVASPLKHAKFEAKLPSQPDPNDRPLPPNPLTLVVTIEADHQLKLNTLGDMGSVEDTAKLSARLVELFQERTRNHAYRGEMLTSVGVPEAARIEKTVFIKASRATSYGDVAKVIDGIKGAGANPIGLQLDGLQ